MPSVNSSANRTGKIKAFAGRHRLLLLMLLTNAVFCVLYRHFILGRAVYMYADIGNDSLSSSYPLLVLISNLLHGGHFDFYSLNAGIGTDITATYLQFLNPIKLLMAAFGRDSLPAGILLSTWLQDNLLSLFSFFFFRRLLRDSRPAVYASFAWTFTGYVVLWGQNYSFLTCILLFTITMAVLQVFLTEPGKKKFLLIPVMALFIISNYYFFYMTGIFTVLYTVLFLLAKKSSFREILKKLFGLFVMAAAAAVMACVSVLPILSSYTNSTRTGQAGALLTHTSRLFVPYGPKTLLTFLGRLFSVNAFGSGTVYSGAVNFYEVAILSVSALFFFAEAYLLFRRKSRRFTLILTAVSVVLLILPVTSQILSVTSSAQRWSFMLCFGETIAIGFFLKSVFEDCDETAYRRMLTAVPLFCLLCALALFLGWRMGLYTLGRKGLALAALFLVLYWLVFFLAKKPAFSVYLPPILLAVLFGELILMNNATVNDRVYLTTEAFRTSYYNDGTEKAVASIKQADSGLFRTSVFRAVDASRYYTSTLPNLMFANEGMVDDFPAMTQYSSTVSKSSSAFLKTYSVYQITHNFFNIDYRQYYLYTLLGGKYLIGDSSGPFLKNMENTLFTKTSLTGDNKEIYENTCALPFGYVYTQRIAKSDLAGRSALDRMRAVTQGYYLTEDRDEAGSKTAASSVTLSEDTADLNSRITEQHDCTISTAGGTLTVTPTGSDPYIVFSVPKPEDGKSAYLDLLADVPEDTRIQPFQLFLSTEGSSILPDYYYDLGFTPDYEELVSLMPENLNAFRLDITIDAGPLVLKKCALVSVSTADDFRTLRKTKISDVSFGDDTYRATVENEAAEGMLCIPVAYSANWTASVNGSKADVVNINGGLCGIRLSSGTSSVVMTYAQKHFTASAAVSGAAVLLFLLFMVLPLLTKKRRK